MIEQPRPNFKPEPKLKPVEYRETGYTISSGLKVSRWAPRPSPAVWLLGRTVSGRTVEIVGDPYVDERSTIVIDGIRACVSHIKRLRDGGTTTIVTDHGIVWYPSRFGANLVSTLDGEGLTS